MLPLGLLTLAAAALFLPGKADPPPESMVLVLTNESVLRGRLERDGDAFRLRGDAGESVVPAHRVLKVCGSLEEAHAYVRGRANLRDPDERLRLARWCERQGLLAEARMEAEAALRLRPQFADAQRFLKLLEGRSAAAQATAASPAPQKAAPAKPAVDHSYSIETLQAFTRRVQPLLINSCGTGACHGGQGAPGLGLIKPLGPGQHTPAMTRQNLVRALRLIDREDPASSPILRKALEAHGGASHAPLVNKDSAAFRSLEAWVQSIAPAKSVELGDSPGVAVRTKAGEPEPEETQAAKPDAAAAPASPPDPAKGMPASPPPRLPGSALQGGRVVGSSNPHLPLPPAAPEPPAKPAVETPKPAARPVDPFDPLPFNKQNHQGKPPPAEKKP